MSPCLMSRLMTHDPFATKVSNITFCPWSYIEKKHADVAEHRSCRAPFHRTEPDLSWQPFVTEQLFHIRSSEWNYPCTSMCVRMSAFLTVCLFVFLSVCLPAYLPVCLYHIFVYRCGCIHCTRVPTAPKIISIHYNHLQSLSTFHCCPVLLFS